ncbi:hypothetical protein ANANG_G00275490, partial [Anguilla anguilla]
PNSQVFNPGFEAPNSQVSNPNYQAPDSQVSNPGSEAPNSQLSNPGYQPPDSHISNPDYHVPDSQVYNPSFEAANSQVSNPDYQALDSQVSNPGFEAPNSQVSNPDYQASDSQVSRGLSLQLDLSSTTDKMAAPHPVQLFSQAPQQHLPRYALPRTRGPLTPERDCTAMSGESHSRPTSAKVTLHCEQPSVPKSPSPLTNPKTAPLLPPSEPPAPKPAPSTLPSRDLFIKTAPSPQPSENLSHKTASPLPLSEPLAPGTSASSSCTHLPPSPGSFLSSGPGVQVTAGEEQFPLETRRGTDMQNSSQSKPTLEITQTSSEALLENNPPDYYHSNQTTANQNFLSKKEQNGGPTPSQGPKYRTRNYEETSEKEPFKPKTIRFADTFTF